MTVDEKIADCKRQLTSERVSDKRRRDLLKWLARLEREKRNDTAKKPVL